MDSLNILIIEDTKSESDELSQVLINHNYSIIGVAANYGDALKMYYANTVDLIIIDVFLNGLPEGITFAETICITPNACKPFIFLTSSKDRHIFDRAKLTKPFGFLMKPFNELEVLYAIEMAIERFYNQTNTFVSEDLNVVLGNEYFFVKKNKSLKKVKLEDLIYIEVEDRYCHLITSNENFIISISLTKMTEFLDEKKFVKTHRNFLVNINKINEIIINDNLIIMEGGHKVILSENYKGFIQNYNLLK